MSGRKTRLIRNISVPLGEDIDLEHRLRQKIHSLVFDNLRIHRRSLDARKPNHLVWQYNVLADVRGNIPTHPDILEYSLPQPYITYRTLLTERHPFIIGAGPAGLFAALALVERGFEPWIFEQGDPLEKRDRIIDSFIKDRKLDEFSNIQFGEGGAGAYSDGKLTARNRDYYTNRIYEYLIRFGADEDIMHEAQPHLGTDVLKKIITNIRQFLTEKGCLFFWRHQLQNLHIKNSILQSVIINGMKYVPEAVILAPGNSARFTFRFLQDKLALEPKDFAVGFRLEHRQEFLNKLFYGDKTDINLTGAASYKLKGTFNKRGVYSFCMCPGGIVVNGASEAKGIVTNGMSYSARSGRFGNAAIVAQVQSRDLGSNLMAGLEFQEHIEESCYLINRNYSAPAQKVNDFISSQDSLTLPENSFQMGLTSSDLSSVYPHAITESLRLALHYWNKRRRGFADKGLLIAPETRTSSPLKILRDHVRRSSTRADNLFPVGEGAGYAGGIISSAADGYKTASIFHH